MTQVIASRPMVPVRLAAFPRREVLVTAVLVTAGMEEAGMVVLAAAAAATVPVVA